MSPWEHYAQGFAFSQYADHSATALRPPWDKRCNLTTHRDPFLNDVTVFRAECFGPGGEHWCSQHVVRDGPGGHRHYYEALRALSDSLDAMARREPSLQFAEPDPPPPDVRVSSPVPTVAMEAGSAVRAGDLLCAGSEGTVGYAMGRDDDVVGVALHAAAPGAPVDVALALTVPLNTEMQNDAGEGSSACEEPAADDVPVACKVPCLVADDPEPWPEPPEAWLMDPWALVAVGLWALAWALWVGVALGSWAVL